jgi:two-component system, OmpR family, sensor histidine kinase KdpD
MADDFSRPDPDSLLNRINEEEKKKEKGNLKIFFGMVAGVGKTYAMLETAQKLKREGVDVIIGYIETHKRAETEALLEGLPMIPRAKIEYRDVVIEELDLDAVLERKPDYVLVDEFAHTNTPGLRHAKRYYDVIEILSKGINVFTTLNVQHLESQIDIVEQITGTKIRETIPDSVLDIADEVELIDIVPEELLKRLAEGKVYTQEKAGLAANNFFRKENIIALREMALRHVAKLVDHDLRDYMKEKKIQGQWKSGESLIVAISPSPYSEYLIRWTRRTAFELKAPWTAVYIDKRKILSVNATKTLLRNMTLARELGADVITTSADDVVKELARVARDRNATQIVIGKPLKRYFFDFLWGGSIVERLLKESGDIEVHIVTQPQREKKAKSLFPELVFSSKASEYTWGIVSVAVMTVINLFIVPFTGYWTIALFYLLLVSIISLFVGRGPSFVSAALSALLWDFLFIPPLYTLWIGKFEDALMFGFFFVIAIITGNLTSRLRSKESALSIREKRISALYDFSRSISSALGTDQIVQTAIQYIGSVFGFETAVMLADGSGALSPITHHSSTLDISQNEYGVASWAFANKRPAGQSTDTLPDAAAYHIPLVTQNGGHGIISIKNTSANSFTIDQENFLQNICYQLSSALEREKMYESIRSSQFNAESERLHTILLNSISHELRTPLTTISGAASGLLDDTISAIPETRTALSLEIKKASDRLNRLVDNLLDMSRLESGTLSLKRQIYYAGDIVSVALRRLEDELSGHKVTTDISPDLPMASFDFALMEQAVVNILHNAAVHTPRGSEITIKVFSRNRKIVIAVSDNGPGIPAADRSRLFDKFRRGSQAAAGGTGLGLSISKGIAEIHGGTIALDSSENRGSTFTIEIPVEPEEK